MRKNDVFSVKKGLPHETKEEPVKSFSLVTEILGAPQRETVSGAGRVGRGRAGSPVRTKAEAEEEAE